MNQILRVQPKGMVIGNQLPGRRCNVIGFLLGRIWQDAAACQRTHVYCTPILLTLDYEFLGLSKALCCAPLVPVDSTCSNHRAALAWIRSARLEPDSTVPGPLSHVSECQHSSTPT
jgi:hypothetical protein